MVEIAQHVWMLMGMTQERKINESMKRDIGEEQQAVARQNHSDSEDSVVQKTDKLCIFFSPLNPSISQWYSSEGAGLVWEKRT